MTFDAAMIEAELEDACEALNLTDDDAAYVMRTHRMSDGELLRELLSRNCDMRGYAECRLAIRHGLTGQEPAYRPGGRLGLEPSN